MCLYVCVCVPASTQPGGDIVSACVCMCVFVSLPQHSLVVTLSLHVCVRMSGYAQHVIVTNNVFYMDALIITQPVVSSYNIHYICACIQLKY